jgi:hypothetical protein
MHGQSLLAHNQGVCKCSSTRVHVSTIECKQPSPHTQTCRAHTHHTYLACDACNAEVTKGWQPELLSNLGLNHKARGTCAAGMTDTAHDCLLAPAQITVTVTVTWFRIYLSTLLGAGRKRYDLILCILLIQVMLQLCRRFDCNQCHLHIKPTIELQQAIPLLTQLCSMSAHPPHDQSHSPLDTTLQCHIHACLYTAQHPHLCPTASSPPCAR